MIKVAHLTKTYGDYIAAKDISFEIPKGCICGFLGPNGAGKSTTMNIITGYLSPSRGSVHINDISMQKNPSKAKKLIGYLPEIPPLYPDMTVTEYLFFVAELKGIKKSDRGQEVLRVTEKTALSNVVDRLIKNLSKGYKQRTGLAAALIGNPEFLILDEPTVGLDPRQIVEIRSLIKELGKDHTVILSSHILSEVSAICDKVVIISHGRVVADDEPAKLVEKYNEAQNFKIVVKGNASKVEETLNTIKNIDSFKFVEEKAGEVTVNITAKKLIDIRESISSSIYNAGLTLLELSIMHISLEDVYLKLTGEEYYKELLLSEGVSIYEEENEDEDLLFINEEGEDE